MLSIYVGFATLTAILLFVQGHFFFGLLLAPVWPLLLVLALVDVEPKKHLTPTTVNDTVVLPRRQLSPTDIQYGRRSRSSLIWA